MTKMTVTAILISLAGCAGTGSLIRGNGADAAGRWSGFIERDGWQRALFLDIEEASGSWRGKWKSFPQGQLMMLRDIEVSGDEIRFGAEGLRFVGHLSGNTLSGVVTDVPAGAPAGE